MSLSALALDAVYHWALGVAEVEATITRTTHGALESDLSRTTTRTAQTVAATPPEAVAAGLIDGTRIKAGDTRVGVSASDPRLAFNPDSGDAVTLAETVTGEVLLEGWTVEEVTPLAGPGRIGWELLLRDGGSE